MLNKFIAKNVVHNRAEIGLRAMLYLFKAQKQVFGIISILDYRSHYDFQPHLVAHTNHP